MPIFLTATERQTVQDYPAFNPSDIDFARCDLPGCEYLALARIRKILSITFILSLPDAIIYHLANQAGYEGDGFDGIIAIKRFLNKYFHSPDMPRPSPQAPSLPTGKVPSLPLHHITSLILLVLPTLTSL